MKALKVSQSNLAAPPPPPSQLPLDNLHLKISDIETDKRRLNNELDLLKQKHDQGEGARRALSQQVCVGFIDYFCIESLVMSDNTNHYVNNLAFTIIL